MSALELHSCLAAQIRKLIDLRRLSGTEYQSQTRLLVMFDRFLLTQGLAGPRLSRELCECYQESLSHLAPKTRHNRLSVVRQLCAYLARTDSHCYVPELMRGLPSRPLHQPYIYSQAEVHALLAAAAQLPPAGSLWPHTCQTLVGLLYSTGIRIGEALALNLEDFHDGDQGLYIAEGKFHKARWLPLSFSGNTALQQYLHRRMRVPPRTHDTPLFLNQRRRRLHYRTVHQTFRRLLHQCGIPANGHTGPRIHDIRHTFAVRRLLVWYRERLDVNTRLPWLATFMGHVGISSTQVYLHATAELLEQVDQRFHNHYLHYVKPEEEK